MDKKNMHWSEIIAKEIEEKKEEPYVIASGITTSGSLHPGTLCEFLFADAIYKAMKGEKKFIFIADILDAFDNVPLAMKKYEGELKEHLGKPLAHTPDPMGCHDSFGEHFLAQAEKAMEKLGAEPEVLKANELYEQGKYDEYAKRYLEEKEKIKEIVQRTSRRESMPEDWSPVLPICEKCGKVATTRVLGYENGEIEYICDKEVRYTKGCGYKGKMKLEDHKYKILFRLDWAARQDFLDVKAEGGSVDHHTKGGTIETVKAVHKEFFGKDNPVWYKFGFLKYMGKKYSKSKGIGHTVDELMEVLPSDVLRYALFRPDIGGDKEMVLEERSLLPLIVDFEQVAELKEEEMSRALRKKRMALKLAGEKRWNAGVQDMLVYYSIYRNWGKTGEKLGDKKGVEYLAPFIEKWIQKSWIPEKYFFEVKERIEDKMVCEFLGKLKEEMSAEEIQGKAFEFAKEKELGGEFFKMAYLALIGKERGPKLGGFIKAVGVEELKKRCR
ncbi:lysine--tRNA ligase [Candidatus Micrarchaeota archaeon]|nr:lysine--tRNA ligase [Candidatus Micrarchaeota archaeon]